MYTRSHSCVSAQICTASCMESREVLARRFDTSAGESASGARTNTEITVESQGLEGSHTALYRRQRVPQEPSGRCEGRLWLGRLERVPPAPAAEDGNVTRFRLLDPKKLLLPASHGLRMSGKEKNWVPFEHDSAVHFMLYSNPPMALRLPAVLNQTGDDVTLEYVSAVSEPVQWRYGKICGGTPGVFDADLGGHVFVFHSKMVHEHNGSLTDCRAPMRTYYMGCAVMSARPPFGIQLMSTVPLAGPESYTRSGHYKHWQVVFPVGLVLTPDAVVLSYGRNDAATRLIRFDRSMFRESLLPPVPEGWDGKRPNRGTKC